MFLALSLPFAGPGDLLLDTASADYQNFFITVGSNREIAYSIYGSNGQQFETGIGELATGGGFLRKQVSRSTNSDAKVDFDYGMHRIALSSGIGSTIPTVQLADADGNPVGVELVDGRYIAHVRDTETHRLLRGVYDVLRDIEERLNHA